jgi:hypothetical protein
MLTRFLHLKHNRLSCASNSKSKENRGQDPGEVTIRKSDHSSFFKKAQWNLVMTQEVEHLPSKHEASSQTSIPPKNIQWKIPPYHLVLKTVRTSGHQRLMPIILTTKEAGSGGSQFEANLGK